MSNESIVEKIKKLLNLSKNAGTEAEAANAATRAQELIDKHHITEAELRGSSEKVKEEPIEDHPLEGGERPADWHWQLADVLAEAFYCRIYRDGSYRLHVVGRETDRQVVSYLFRFLVNEIGRIGALRWAARGTPGIEDILDIDAEAPAVAPVGEYEWMTSFQRGAIERIKERLGERRAKLPAGMSQANAMVLQQLGQDVVLWMRTKLPTLRSVPLRSVSTSAEGYREGRAAGSVVHVGAEGSRSKRLN